MFKKLFGPLFAIVIVLYGTNAFAKQVTVNVSDISFEVAKSILLGLRNGSDYKGLSDDAIKTVLENRKTFDIDDGLLPSDIRLRLDAQRKLTEVTVTMEEGQKWAQMGRAIGIATKEGLNAITTETANFANTTPGRFTMAMIAWKVMGKEFLSAIKGYLISVPLLVFCCWMFFRQQMLLYRGYERKKVMKGGESNKEKIVTTEWIEPLMTQMKKEGKDNYDSFVILVGLKSAVYVVVGAIIYATI